MNPSASTVIPLKRSSVTRTPSPATLKVRLSSNLDHTLPWCYKGKAREGRQRVERQYHTHANRKKQCRPNKPQPYSSARHTLTKPLPWCSPRTLCMLHCAGLRRAPATPPLPHCPPVASPSPSCSSDALYGATTSLMVLTTAKVHAQYQNGKNGCYSPGGTGASCM